jgi:PleD family two-component response regulator
MGFLNYVEPVHKKNLVSPACLTDASSSLSARHIKNATTYYLHKPYCHKAFFGRIMQKVKRSENTRTIRRIANSDYLVSLPNRRHFSCSLRQI